ncbi:NACHT domain-containing protein [Acidovorax sp.]|uniref:NACHT domain-containing protein n=1 Tax=Acidovorax sp. TaxID=1872122 RepID=UPI00391F17C6
MNQLIEHLEPWLMIAVDWYHTLSNSSWWPMVVAVFGLLGTLFGAVRGVTAVKQYRFKKQAAKAHAFQDEEARLKWFQPQDFLAAAQDYLEPYCSNVDPSDREDLRNTVAVREPVLAALDRELDAEDNRHILVLGDSGMGKTTLMLNLVSREQRRRTSARRLALIPLGEPGALDAIRAIPAQRETILLLDALDEDPRAIEDASARMSEIMTAASAFKKVVMTCRTQFFASDSEIPQQTGLKRLAARRAGEPVGYQWRTVYLEPFDRKQIDSYVRNAIPWWKLDQRRKARRIVADVSDLAARPMLTALIPELAKSDREAHTLWDLYAFMVEQWIDRESSWIAQDALRKLSKAIAVEIVLQRKARGGERVSKAQLTQLAEEQNVLIETWKLTSRSLLNRDADGLFKFAHRSILEYFFVESFIQGDKRCLNVKWTDMMCDLFLSWGMSTQADDASALHLLEMDFRETGLFPIVDRHEPSTRIDAIWAKKALSDRDTTARRSKFPNSWRIAVAHVIRRMTVLRAYDFADGLVWQIQDTHEILDRDERWIYHCDRFSLRGVDAKKREWAVVDLYELELLCDILDKRDILFAAIDQRELYWLSDTDGVYSTLARVRTNENSQAEIFSELELLHSGKTSANRTYVIDVYRVVTKSLTVGKIRAMSVLAHHGDAAAMHAADTDAIATTSWDIARGLRTPVSKERLA